jgi:hypothetical protein
MKKMSLPLKVGLLLTILLASTLPAQAEAEKTEFTGLSHLAGLLDPGVETYPDGNVHVRGLTLLYFDHLSDPRVTGFDTVVVNYNMQTVSPPVLITGPMWGTLHIENEGGYWDGTWTGERDEQGFAYLRGVAHGHGGYEGLKVNYDLTRLSPDPNDTFTITGTIIDPQGE